jgi:WD40 repeat protein
MTEQSRGEIEHLEELAGIYRQHIRVLDEQLATFGLYAPTYKVMERQSAESALAKVQAQLRRLRAPVAAERAPYVGLSAFQARDADLFFGREVLINELLARVARDSLVVVLGASGVGKSSAVRAGLLPELRSGALPGSQGWRYAIVEPGPRPLDALAAGLAALDRGRLGDAVELRRSLAEDDHALLLAARMACDDAAGGRLALIVDQAEELWTLCPAEPDARAQFMREQHEPFVRQLLTAADAAQGLGSPPILIVLTMRLDVLQRAAENPRLARWIGGHDVLVGRPAPDELRVAIERPAVALGYDFEPGLVEALVDDVRREPGGLPLLQYALLELWKRRTPEGTLTWQAFHDLGKVAGAIAGQADALLARHYAAEGQLDRLRRALLRLVQPVEGVGDTRRRVALADLAPADQDAEAVRLLLAPLIEARLLTIGSDDRGDQTIEIAHEALVHAWPRFGEWVEGARDDMLFQIRLDEAAREWEENQADPDYLWLGNRLTRAATLLERARPQVGRRVQRFLDASRVATAEAEDARLRSRSRRERDYARRLADLARQPDLDLEIALLLGCEALAWHDDFHTQQVVRDALARFAPADSLLAGHESWVACAGFSPSGQRIVTTSADKTARLWDVRARQIVALRGHLLPIYCAAFSPDGRQVLTASADKTARLWGANGQVLAILAGHGDAVVHAAFSPDGRQVLTASADKTARLWGANGQPAALLAGHTSGVVSGTFSSDGRWIVTASGDKTARLWGANGQERAILRGHTNGLTGVALSPDDRWIVTTSYDKTARLWDREGQERAILRGHTNGLTGAGFSPDSRWIVTTSYDRTARLHHVQAATLLAQAADCITRGPTSEEIARFQLITPLRFSIER